MSAQSTYRNVLKPPRKQHGVVLFFALIALVVMLLAAVALIRAVDTGALISGNLAFVRSTATSGDLGADQGIDWVAGIDTANSAKNIYSDMTHPLNNTDATIGYYSNADPLLDMTSAGPWDAIDVAKVPVVLDASGNSIKYIVQRMCNNPNVVLSTTNCLFSDASESGNDRSTPRYAARCTPPPPPAPNGCPLEGQAVQYRITSRARGGKNAVSYIQTFVY